MSCALSIILPCFGASRLARDSVGTLVTALDAWLHDWEIVIVDDGGNDFNRHRLPDHPRVRLLAHDRNRGKGAAVKTGMLAAGGAVRIYTDIDLPYDLDLLPTLAWHIKRGFHLAIGDRTMPGSEYAEATTARRQLVSRMASSFIGSLVTGGFHDTQCGIKAIRGDVAEALFPLVRINGFAFDVEVLYIALKHHLDIKRVPVQLRRNATSSVRLLRDSLQGLQDVLSIKGRQLQNQYYSQALESIVLHEAEDARYGVGDPGSTNVTPASDQDF